MGIMSTKCELRIGGSDSHNFFLEEKRLEGQMAMNGID